MEFPTTFRIGCGVVLLVRKGARLFVFLAIMKASLPGLATIALLLSYEQDRIRCNPTYPSVNAYDIGTNT